MLNLSKASRCQQVFSKTCLVNIISKDTQLVFSISQQAFSKPCMVNMISKDTHLYFSLSPQASRCQQAFLKPCLVNFISKDTHLVFSISHNIALEMTDILKNNIQTTLIIYLSYGVASGSEITPCNRIDKSFVVYRFTGNVMTSITTLRT